MLYNLSMNKLKSISQHQRFPEITLFIITILWGGTFLTIQYALTLSSPMFFVGCRFAAAACAILFFSWTALKGTSSKDLIAGLVIGAMITIGYGAQTIGLQSILSTESAFLTALYVPLVPILQWIFFRKFPKIMTWLGILLAFVGLILLTGNLTLDIALNQGQIFTLISAIAIAMEIIFIGLFANKVNTQRVTIIQLIAASGFSFLSMPLLSEDHFPNFSWGLLGVVVVIGIASAMIQFTMNWAQRYVDPTKATIIYTGEPVWAGVFGRMAGEHMSPYALVGAILVVFGVLISELKPSIIKKKLLQQKRS